MMMSEDAYDDDHDVGDVDDKDDDKDADDDDPTCRFAARDQV